MKAICIIPLIFLNAQSALGHSIFQRLRVNDVDQGQLVAVRAPAVNNPVQTVTSPPIACNTGLYTPVSTDIVTVPAGAKVGAWYEHILGGPQGANDADNPIAASHKGPIMAYIAKVDDAATADWTGVEWFKVAEEGLNTDTGTWAVDSMIAGAGWWNFTMPECVEAGQYLLRVELIALHSAYGENGAQFYMSCANIAITGSGTNPGNDTVQFPGAYTASDPGILINIYDGSVPNNGLKPYPIPGPSVLDCAA